jgi:phosphopantothenoylcysteine decarboxylase/phosphopantothenate--cysteine ligase
MKKGTVRLQLELEPTPDILKRLAKQPNGQIVVGFAAETDHLIENARAKLKAKNLDLVVANDVLEPDAGFAADTNRVTLIRRDRTTRKLDAMSKLEVANCVLDEVVGLRSGKKP